MNFDFLIMLEDRIMKAYFFFFGGGGVPLFLKKGMINNDGGKVCFDWFLDRGKMSCMLMSC